LEALGCVSPVAATTPQRGAGSCERPRGSRGAKDRRGRERDSPANGQCGSEPRRARPTPRPARNAPAGGAPALKARRAGQGSRANPRPDGRARRGC
jgi:hypothetical protein